MHTAKQIMKWGSTAVLLMVLLAFLPFGQKAQAKTADSGLVITNVSVTVKAPAAGTVITMDDNLNQPYFQSPYPDFSVPSGRGYVRWPNGQPAFWINSPYIPLSDGGDPSFFNGTVQGGQVLYAYLAIVAETGNRFDENVSVSVSGGDLYSKQLSKYGVVSLEGDTDLDREIGADIPLDSANNMLILQIKVTVPAEGGSETPAPAPHEHNFVYEITKEPTETEDGECAYICSICGAVEQRLPLTGFAVFLKNAKKAITNAASGANVKIETGLWMSFDSEVLDALAGRPDITTTITYQYKGEWYVMTIPAESNILSLKNEEGYAGFLYMATIFGSTPR